LAQNAGQRAAPARRFDRCSQQSEVAANGKRSGISTKSRGEGRFRTLDSLNTHFQNNAVWNRSSHRQRAFGGDAAAFADGRTKENDVKKEEVLAKVASGDLSIEEASKMLADEAPKRGTLYCKVSPKGAVSVYGLQRMPVTLYVEQWERLLGFSDDIRGFLKDHDSELKRKEK
jgi:hypothetical protein